MAKKGGPQEPGTGFASSGRRRKKKNRRGVMIDSCKRGLRECGAGNRREEGDKESKNTRSSSRYSYWQAGGRSLRAER